jgi:histidyl-tRNA synthetase
MPRTKKAAATRKRKKGKLVKSVTGMHDIVPADYKYWDYCMDIIHSYADIYGYHKISTPVVEKTDLFKRAIGEETDIVGKEMYTFKDQGNESLTLRPEFSASKMRAYIEDGLESLPKPVKLLSSGPVYRREKPQAGRFRQFHQADFDVYGSEKPVIDAEVIFTMWSALKKMGLENVVVKINSIGTYESRKEYIDVLVDYFGSKKALLSAEEKTRLKKNPLRLLDSKNKKLKDLIAEAPQSIDYLDQESHDHFKDVLEYLDEVGVTYHLDHTLVRGLDYYTRTTFEFMLHDPEKDEYSLTLAAGGRYDDLAYQLGAKEDVPAVGVSVGLERVIELLKDAKIEIKTEKKADVFLAQLGELSKKKSLKIFNELIEAGISVKQSFHRDSIKSQLKQADKFDVKLSLILGQKEALEDTILVRDMSSGIQEETTQKNLVKEIKNRLKKASVSKKAG